MASLKKNNLPVTDEQYLKSHVFKKQLNTQHRPDTGPATLVDPSTDCQQQ